MPQERLVQLQKTLVKPETLLEYGGIPRMSRFGPFHRIEPPILRRGITTVRFERVRQRDAIASSGSGSGSAFRCKRQIRTASAYMRMAFKREAEASSASPASRDTPASSRSTVATPISLSVSTTPRCVNSSMTSGTASPFSTWRFGSDSRYNRSSSASYACSNFFCRRSPITAPNASVICEISRSN